MATADDEVRDEPPPAIVVVGVAWRVAMALFLVVFAALTLIFNGTKLRPLNDLRVTTKFGMFSGPPKAQPILVIGVPRAAPTQLRVISDPTATTKPWLQALRDARERKLSDNVAKTPSLLQAYLAYHCERNAAEIRELRLVSVGSVEIPEATVASRRCDPPRRGAGDGR